MTSSRFAILGLGAALCAFASGCAPKLASGTYGSEEKQWNTYIKGSYRNWDAPPALPPMVDPSEPGPASTALPAAPALPDASMPPTIIVEDISTPVVIGNVEIINVPAMTRPEKYAVKKGDTLWGISKKFYGQGTKWHVIRDANPGATSNANHLKPGTVLSIPTP